MQSIGVASSISEGDIFIYSCSAQLISFEIRYQSVLIFNTSAFKLLSVPTVRLDIVECNVALFTHLLVTRITSKNQCYDNSKLC